MINQLYKIQLHNNVHFNKNNLIKQNKNFFYLIIFIMLVLI